MEWLLIWAVLERKVDWGVVEKVDAEFFSDVADRKIWSMLKKCCEDGVLVRNWDDLYLLGIRDGVGTEVLDRIESYGSKRIELSDGVLVDTLGKMWKEKVLVSGLKRIEDSLLKEGSVERAVREVFDVYYKVSEDVFGISGKCEGVFDNVLQRVISYGVEGKEEEWLLSGISGLDAVLGKGFRRGTLVVWLGATSVGKTMMLVFQSMVFMLQGKNVLFLSLEDSKEVILERFDNVLFNVVKSNAEEVKRRVEWLKELGEVKVVYRSGMSVEEVEGFLQEGNVDVLVIDYGDLLRMGGRWREDWQVQGEIFEKLMKYAGKYNVWVVTASQATREALEKRLISLANISRSFRKVQVADYVIALMQTKEEEQKGELRLVVLKNRFGRRGDVISLKVLREYGWFKEL